MARAAAGAASAGKVAVLTRLPPAMRLTGIGFYFALCIIGGILAGLAVDSWLGTRPVFILAGLFVGLGAAFWGGYLLLMEVLGLRKPEKDGDEV